MHRALLIGAVLILASVAPPHSRGGPPVQFEDAKLIAGDAERGDVFGVAVAITCDVAVVGAPGDDDRGVDYGAAYVFRRKGTAWVEAQKLLSPPPFGGDDGFSNGGIAISGDTIMVGAPTADAPFPASGAVYVFRRDGDDWAFQQELVASDAGAFGYFGVSPDIDGDVAVVGSLPNSGQGAIYVFRQHEDTWIEVQTLFSPNAGEADDFGFSVAVSGDTIVAGARFSKDNGAAHVFRWNGSMWLREQTLVASDGAFEDQFGYSIAVAQETLLIGAPSADAPLAGAGAAYVYELRNGIWVEAVRLLSPDPEVGGAFGEAVALSADLVAVGQLGPGPGATYVYEKVGMTWSLNRMLAPADGEGFDGFGGAIAVRNGYCVVGAGANDDACPDDPHCNSGSAYVFLLEKGDCNGNSVPDRCDPDCNLDGTPDDCEIANCSGDPACTDCNANGVPDGCELDCNANSVADECDIAACYGDPACADHNGNGIPDGCEFGACCEYDAFGGCRDNLVREQCDCPTCEWTETTSCADVQCFHEPIPTVGAWGLTVLSLLLLIGAKVRWGNR